MSSTHQLYNKCMYEGAMRRSSGKLRTSAWRPATGRMNIERQASTQEGCHHGPVFRKSNKMLAGKMQARRHCTNSLLSLFKQLKYTRMGRREAYSDFCMISCHLHDAGRVLKVILANLMVRSNDIHITLCIVKLFKRISVWWLVPFSLWDCAVQVSHTPSYKTSTK